MLPMMTLEDFLAHPIRNTWIYEPPIEVYLRKGIHYIAALSKPCLCLDIANVEVEHDKQRQGVFKAWLKKAEQLCPFECVYIENVQNPVLHDFLVREGYSPILNWLTPSYYKLV